MRNELPITPREAALHEAGLVAALAINAKFTTQQIRGDWLPETNEVELVAKQALQVAGLYDRYRTNVLRVAPRDTGKNYDNARFSISVYELEEPSGPYWWQQNP
jgi:hypothetical protein